MFYLYKKKKVDFSKRNTPADAVVLTFARPPRPHAGPPTAFFLQVLSHLQVQLAFLQVPHFAPHSIEPAP